jgi:hypothetical protein
MPCEEVVEQTVTACYQQITFLHVPSVPAWQQCVIKSEFGVSSYVTLVAKLMEQAVTACY